MRGREVHDRPDRACALPDILLLNANTNTAMTDKMLDVARDIHANCRGATVARGHKYVSDQDTALVAAEAVAEFTEKLDAETTPDALVIACFGDPGLWTVRDNLPIPVIGMAEASCHVACQMGRRFAIVTGGAAWEPMLRDFVGHTGLSSRLSGIYTLEQTGDVLAADPHYALPFIGKKIDLACREGADVVILGGAGMVGFADLLRPDAELPILDSLTCAISQAVALASVQQLCLFAGLNLPRCGGFDDRVGDYDQPSCDCDDDQLVRLSALLETHCYRLENWIVAGGREGGLEEHMSQRPSFTRNLSAAPHLLSFGTGAKPVMAAASPDVIPPS